MFTVELDDDAQGFVEGGVMAESKKRRHRRVDDDAQGLVEGGVMAESKKRRHRRGEPVPDVAAFVVRGDLLDPAVLAASAQENHVIYGFYGVSVFAEVGGDTWEEIAVTKLRRAEWIVLFIARALLASGVELWDTGQAPHYDIVHADLDQLVGRILGCEHRVVENPVRAEGAPS